MKQINNFLINSYIVFVIVFVQSVNSTAQPNQIDDIIVENDWMFHLSEMMKDCEEAYNGIELYHSTSFDQYNGSEVFAGINTGMQFLQALRSDIDKAIQNNNSSYLLQGQTIEKLMDYGIDKAYDMHLGSLGKLYGVKNLTAFGTDDVVKGIALQAKRGVMDVDVITHYLDGINKAAWGVLGFYHGTVMSGGNVDVGLKYSKAYQQIAGAAASHLRQVTLPIFEKATLAFSNNKAEIINNYYVLQNRRIKEGLLVQQITDVYSEKELKGSGMSDAEIYSTNQNALNLNAHQLSARKQWTNDDFKSFDQGEIDIGGVMISPEIDYTKEDLSSLFSEIIEDRPSVDTLFWDYER